MHRTKTRLLHVHSQAGRALLSRLTWNALLCTGILLCSGGALSARADDLLGEIDVVPLTGRPEYLVLAPLQSELYVVARGEGSESNRDTVFVVNTLTRAITDTIPIDVGFAMDLDITPLGENVYLAVSKSGGGTTSTGSDRVEVIDTASKTVSVTIPRPADTGPIGVAVTPNGSLAVITNRGGGTVDCIDTSSNLISGSIDVPGAPVGIAISPSGEIAYTACRDNSTLYALDLHQYSVLASIPLDLNPSSSITSVAIPSSGTYAYVTTSSDSRVAVVDIDPGSPLYHEQIELIATSGTAHREICLVSDDRAALVADFPSDCVCLIDTDVGSPYFHSEVDTICVGSGPFGVVAGAAHAVAYVSNFSGGTVSVLDTIPSERTVPMLDRAGLALTFMALCVWVAWRCAGRRSHSQRCGSQKA